MLSTQDLKDSICRWLSDGNASMSFSIEQHQCELIQDDAGVSCMISVGAGKDQIPDTLLLQLTQAGLQEFPGTPVLSKDGQYMLAARQNLNGELEDDGEKLLAMIEILSNQAVVWNELLIHSNPHQSLRSQQVHTQNDRLRFTSRLTQHPKFF